MPAGLMERVTPTHIPDAPDLDRMRRDRIARVRDHMRAQGLDAVVLIGNTNVVYADRRDVAARRPGTRQLRTARRRGAGR